MTDEDQPDRDAPSNENDNSRLLDRRAYLGLGAAAVSAAVGASAVNASNGEPGEEASEQGRRSSAGANRGGKDSGAEATHHGISFSRDLHAVDDLGLDPNGNEPIDGDVPQTDDTLVSFPPGTYLIENEIDLKDVTNWGIRGISGDRSDVRFVIPDREVLDCFSPSGRNVLMENVTFDQGPENHTSIGNQFIVEDGLQIHNVEYAGFNPNMKTGANHSLAVKVTDPDGVGVIEGFVHTGPTDFAEDTLHNAIPLWTGAEAEGTLYVRNAHIENGGQHSVYGSKTKGPVIVEGGLFKNCQNTHMRLCGEGSTLRNATIVIDTDNAHPDNQGYYTGSTGIWWESGAFGQKGGLIENCDIICKSSGPNSGLIQVDETAGAMTIRDTRIRNEVEGVPSITCQRPGDSPFGYDAPETPHDVTIENVSITGAGGNGEVLDIVARDGSVVRNSCLSGGNGDGIRLVDSDDCTIENVNIDVSGEATVFENSTASTTDITHSASCPLPDTDVEAVEGNGPEPAPETDLDHRIEIDGSGGEVAYEFEVDGELEALEPDEEDGVQGSVATGTVSGGSDYYGFSGDLTSFDADGSVAVRVDGSSIDTAFVGARKLEIELADSASADVAWYEFEVSDSLEGVGLNSEDEVSGTTGSGGVAGGVDTYAFTGDIVSFTSDVETTVRVDGEVVDVAEVVGRSLEIESEDGSEVAYEFSVDGDLEAVDAADGTVDGNGASGTVAGGTHTYRFTGAITSFVEDGDLTVRVAGESVDHEALAVSHLPNSITIDGSAAESEASYAFEVSGDLAKDDSASIEEADDLTGRSVSGSVANAQDTFRFSGDLVAFDIDGYAQVAFDVSAN